MRREQQNHLPLNLYFRPMCSPNYGMQYGQLWKNTKQGLNKVKKMQLKLSAVDRLKLKLLVKESGKKEFVPKYGMKNDLMIGNNSIKFYCVLPMPYNLKLMK